MERKIPWIYFLPVAFFMWGPRLFDKIFYTSSWNQPFYWGAGIAVALIFYLYLIKESFDFIALGSYLFLLYGAVGYLLHSPLLYPYKNLKQSGLFLTILFFGIVASIVRKEGFLQLPEQFHSSSSTGSLGLLILTFGAFLLSYTLSSYVCMSIPFAVGIPFIALLTGRELYFNYITNKNTPS